VSRLALLAVAIATGATGCGTDDVDLAGTYQVDSAVASEPCGADSAEAMPPLYLKLTKSSFFGTDYFSMEQCADAAGTDCAGGGLFGDSFTEPIDNGWRGITTSSSSGGSSAPTCTLVYARAEALLAGAKLTVEGNDYSAVVDNTEALCTTDEAQRRGDSMPCVRHEKLEATKL
jgi:hypothetical protein